MGLYWKDLEILPGMLLEVELVRPDAFDEEGRPLRLTWQILDFGIRLPDDAYLLYKTGKKFPLKKVVKSRRLQSLIEKGQLLQLPAGTDYMVVEEGHNGTSAGKKCCNLDMLAAVRSIRVLV